MKKITSLLTALTVSAISSAALAAGWEDDWSESDMFIGVEGGYAKTKVKLDGDVGADRNDSTGFFGVRLGSVLDDEARVYFTLGYSKPKDAHWPIFSSADATIDDDITGIKQWNLLVSADYMFMPEWDFRPFAGLTLGAAATKSDDFKRKWGVAYGAQAGLVYQLGDIDLEAGVKYLTNNSDHKWHSHDDKWKLKVNDSRQAYLAASYHF